MIGNVKREAEVFWQWFLSRNTENNIAIKVIYNFFNIQGFIMKGIMQKTKI